MRERVGQLLILQTKLYPPNIVCELHIRQCCTYLEIIFKNNLIIDHGLCGQKYCPLPPSDIFCQSLHTAMGIAITVYRSCLWTEEEYLVELLYIVYLFIYLGYLISILVEHYNKGTVTEVGNLTIYQYKNQTRITLRKCHIYSHY